MMTAAKSAGAVANKICGAGGGGCMISAARPKDVPAVRKALAEAGAQVLPATLTNQGMQVKRY